MQALSDREGFIPSRIQGMWHEKMFPFYITRNQHKGRAVPARCPSMVPDGLAIEIKRPTTPMPSLPLVAPAGFGSRLMLSTSSHVGRVVPDVKPLLCVFTSWQAS